MTKTLDATYNRVAIFTSHEVQLETAPDVWTRDKRKSSLPISELVNNFLIEKKAVALFVSPPTITLTSASTDMMRNIKTRTYHYSVSVIYRPDEIVIDENIQEGKLEDELDIDLAHIPVEQREQIRETIQREIETKPGPDSTPLKIPTVRVPATKLAALTAAARSSVQPRTDRPNNGRNVSARVPRTGRPKPASKRAGK